MKLNFLFVFALIASVTMFSCEYFQPENSDDCIHNGVDTCQMEVVDTTTNEGGGGIPITPNIGGGDNIGGNGNDVDIRISFETANERVNKYFNITKETGPFAEVYGYHMIRKDRIAPWVNNLNDTVNTIYASLVILPVSFRTDLLFHLIRPNSNGTLTSYQNDDFILSDPVDGEDNETIIQAYNDLYSRQLDDGESELYIQSRSENEKVLVPRYFSFNRADLDSLIAHRQEYDDIEYYASWGAELDTATTNSKNDGYTYYTSDLIFHFLKPEDGYRLREHTTSITETLNVAGSGGDHFYDVTVPCPKECPDPPPNN
ncbi:MAG: hypothetical protein AAFO82_09905 [Bacteroidota bacterium]